MSDLFVHGEYHLKKGFVGGGVQRLELFVLEYLANPLLLADHAILGLLLELLQL